MRDAKNDPIIKEELIREGGKYKVPCLRIGVDAKNSKWLYDSKEICLFLNKKFGLNP